MFQMFSSLTPVIDGLADAKRLKNPKPRTCGFGFRGLGNFPQQADYLAAGPNNHCLQTLLD